VLINFVLYLLSYSAINVDKLAVSVPISVFLHGVAVIRITTIKHKNY